jgi:TetR/AcrR family transcriptional regulator of autoinduction and epiphytic fitness
MGKPRKRRPYDASGRQRRATENRERLLEVARRLFAERGYAETPLEAIAKEAQVALPTLYAAFQSKRGILSALLNRLVSGHPASPPILQTPGARAVLAERDPRRALQLFAEDIVRIQERVGPTYEVMKNAARTEADVAELFARAQQNRYTNLKAVTDHLADLGALRDGLTREDAARTLWVLASPDVRHMLATHAGWSAERYRAWLEQTLAAAFLSH